MSRHPASECPAGVPIFPCLFSFLSPTSRCFFCCLVLRCFLDFSCPDSGIFSFYSKVKFWVIILIIKFRLSNIATNSLAEGDLLPFLADFLPDVGRLFLLEPGLEEGLSTGKGVSTTDSETGSGSGASSCGSMLITGVWSSRKMSRIRFSKSSNTTSTSRSTEMEIVFGETSSSPRMDDQFILLIN